MSDQLKVVTRGLGYSRENLQRAERKLEEWEPIYFQNKTNTEQTIVAFGKHSETIYRKAKVKQCRARLNRYLSLLHALVISKNNKLQ